MLQVDYKNLLRAKKEDWKVLSCIGKLKHKYDNMLKLIYKFNSICTPNGIFPPVKWL